MQKKNHSEYFWDPLLDLKNVRPPLFDMKIMGQPHRKSYKLNFPGKFVVIFFKATLKRVKTFKDPPFCIRNPATSACERSLIPNFCIDNIFSLVMSKRTTLQRLRVQILSCSCTGLVTYSPPCSHASFGSKSTALSFSNVTDSHGFREVLVFTMLYRVPREVTLGCVAKMIHTSLIFPDSTGEVEFMHFTHNTSIL